MKIYIATSWKNAGLALAITELLRTDGHEVDCFCDSGCGRYVFHWSEFVEKEEDLQNYDAISFLHDSRTERAFQEDKKWLDWAEAVVMIMPCGRSAHLEAGYAVGKGKPVYAIGQWPKGEFDVMYGFFEALYRGGELGLLRSILHDDHKTDCGGEHESSAL